MIPTIVISPDRSDALALPRVPVAECGDALCPCGAPCDRSRVVGTTPVCETCAPRPHVAPVIPIARDRVEYTRVGGKVATVVHRANGDVVTFPRWLSERAAIAAARTP